MSKAKLSYTAAFDELQQILTELEDGTISLDDLSDKIQRAGTLLDICQKKLFTTEENVAALLRQINSESEAPPPADINRED